MCFRGIPKLFIFLFVLAVGSVPIAYAQPDSSEKVVDLDDPQRPLSPLARWFRSKDPTTDQSPYNQFQESQRFLGEAIRMKEQVKAEFQATFRQAEQRTLEKVELSFRAKLLHRLIYDTTLSYIQHQISKYEQKLQHPTVEGNSSLEESLQERLARWNSRQRQWLAKKELAATDDRIKAFKKVLKYDLAQSAKELYFFRRNDNSLVIIPPEVLQRAPQIKIAGKASIDAANGKLIIHIKHNRMGDVVSFVQGGKKALPLDWQRHEERQIAQSSSKLSYALQTLKEIFLGRTDFDQLQAKVLMTERVKAGSDVSGTNHWVAWEDAPLQNADMLNSETLNFTPKPKGLTVKARLDAVKNYLWAVYESSSKATFKLGLFAGTVQGGITGLVTAYKLGKAESFADLTWMELLSHQATLESTAIAFGFGFFFGFIQPLYKNWRDLGGRFTRFVKNAASTQAFSYLIRGITSDATAAPEESTKDKFSFKTKEGLTNHADLTVNMGLKNWLKVSLFDIPRMRFIVGANDKPFELKLYKIAVNIPKLKTLLFSRFSRERTRLLKEHPELKNWLLNLNPEQRNKLESLSSEELSKLKLSYTEAQNPLIKLSPGKSLLKTQESAYTIESQLVYTFVAFTLGTIHAIFPEAVWLLFASIPTLSYLGKIGAEHYAKQHPDNFTAKQEAEVITKRWDKTWGRIFTFPGWMMTPYGGTFELSQKIQPFLRGIGYYTVHPLELLKTIDNKILDFHNMLFHPREFWAQYYDNKIDRMSPSQRKQYRNKLEQQETAKYQKMMGKFHTTNEGSISPAPVPFKAPLPRRKCAMLFASAR